MNSLPATDTDALDEDSLGNTAQVEVTICLTLGEIDRLTRIAERVRRSGDASTRRACIPDTRLPEADAQTQSMPLASFARFLIQNRRRRDALFDGLEFGEAIWDMMLDLYVSRAENRPVSVSSLCIAAAVPPTTALRWITVMEDAGHFIRERDQEDRRRVFVRLSFGLNQILEEYLEDLRQRTIHALSKQK